MTHAFDLYDGKASIYVVDDDAEALQELTVLLAHLNADVKTYQSAEDLLRAGIAPDAHCLIAEVGLPDINGIELMQRIQQQGIRLPTIFLARASDVPTAVKAMQAGAIDFIDKPIIGCVLLGRVRQIIRNFHYMPSAP